MWSGQLLHIHIAEKESAPMQELAEAELIPGHGIRGDRYATGRGKYSAIPDIREVTLIETETLQALARDHGTELQAEEHRRNLTTQDAPLNHLVGKQFAIGPVILEGGRLNTPCRYFELLTQKKDIYTYLLNRSGLNCRIIKGGTISAGMKITPV